MKRRNPYDLNNIGKCSVCGEIVMVDDFGNGTCNNCGWEQYKECELHPNIVAYPNMVSLNKAKKFYSRHQKFKPSFEDFVEGMQMYGEMEFMYNFKEYGVFYYSNDVVEFFENNKPETMQRYISVKEFITKSNINGKLLSEIWNKIENPNYMQCK